MPLLTVRTGLALVVLSAFGFAAAPSLARLAFEGGSDPATAAFFRFASGVVVLYPIHRLRGGRLPLNRGLLLAGAAAGALYAAESMAFLAALSLIPVGVTVLVFFTFPVMVALIVRVVDRVPVTPVKIVSLAGAFLGVALTTGAAPTALDPLGVALALFAALGTAAFIVLGGRLTRRIGSIGFTLLAFAAAAGVFGIWLMAAGRLNLPETLLGWVGLLGGSAAFVAAILCFFTALKAVDTISATLLANLEPLLAVTIAYLLLGEVLSTTQLFGGAVVLGSVILPTLAGRRECGNTLTKTK